MGSALNFLIIWLLNATLVPGINESHYLTKAKHAWDPTFAPGDLFLASGNAHWLFAQIAGWLTTFMPLAAVAWVGRVLSWLLTALAWQRLGANLRFPHTINALALAGWIVAVKMGNWAGEWSVGGFEAKALAYPFVVWALAELIAGRWTRVWWLAGIAVAFHPLVGGWAGVTFAALWLWRGRQQSPLKAQLVPGLIAVAISLVGVLPALSMIGGPGRSGDVIVAQIHAFYRLAHHQSPRLFDLSQHIAGGCSLLLLIVVTALVARAWPEYEPEGELEDARSRPSNDNGLRVRALLCVAWLSVAVSGCGLIVDVIGARVRPDVAASLLRFYWFRWSDVMVPLATTCALWSYALELRSGSKRPTQEPRRAVVLHRNFVALSLLITISTVALGGYQVIKHWKSHIAPADRTLLMSDNPQLASGPEVVMRWRAVCAWIADNTPSDALFLTPRAQQTFKWYAGRAEVVTFKDVPQDGRSLLEWYERIGRCAPPRSAAGEPLGWSTAQLKRLQARYHFQYVVVDRRIQLEPPLLEIVYPLNARDNATYAVFKFPAVVSIAPH